MLESPLMSKQLRLDHSSTGPLGPPIYRRFKKIVLMPYLDSLLLDIPQTVNKPPTDCHQPAYQLILSDILTDVYLYFNMSKYLIKIIKTN